MRRIGTICWMGRNLFADFVLERCEDGFSVIISIRIGAYEIQEDDKVVNFYFFLSFSSLGSFCHLPLLAILMVLPSSCLNMNVLSLICFKLIFVSSLPKSFIMSSSALELFFIFPDVTSQ